MKKLVNMGDFQMEVEITDNKNVMIFDQNWGINIIIGHISLDNEKNIYNGCYETSSYAKNWKFSGNLEDVLEDICTMYLNSLD